MTRLNRFADTFEALTGYKPLCWQSRLFSQMARGQFPATCDLPTGLGKTSVIPIWLIALTEPIPDGTPTKLPRRLIYIVNRRTVVDQATKVVEQIRDRLAKGESFASLSPHHQKAVDELHQRLHDMSAGTDEQFLAISALRGQLADNEEWKSDPTRPAIIVGTIDMIGSKLLFSGYGDGRYGRAQHAGLIGQDALVVHDEAHLTPAFSEVLRGVADAQRQACEPRPACLMELSATTRGGTAQVFTLEPEDEQDQIVQERLTASKWLHLEFLNKDEELTDTLAKIAMRHKSERAKVLVYVRSPEDALKVAAQIKKELGKKAEARVALLTGTIRGHERDRLVTVDPVYRALMDYDARPSRTVYLVSTSAGEVGIDLDADHLVCDLTTLDSLIQRLGRVNRRGGRGREAVVDVVLPAATPKENEQPSEYEKAIKATGEILKRWNDAPENDGPREGIDVSPGKLSKLMDRLSAEDRAQAFSPKPLIPPLTDILLDAWSLTSIDEAMPGRPEVSAYLHGLTNDQPETAIAWRSEVSRFSDAKIEPDALGDWFRVCRIEAHESLREPTSQVKKKLKRLLEAHRKNDKRPNLDFPVVILDERGNAQWADLSAIADKDFKLAYRTLLLPVEAGGLSAHGALDEKVIGPAQDVADELGKRERRVLTERTGDLISDEPLIKLDEDAPAAMTAPFVECYRQALALPPDDGEKDGESQYLVLLTPPRHSALETQETMGATQMLPEHTHSIENHMERIADALGLEPALKEALLAAAQWHDRGKNRPVWQRYACNDDPANPIAKSKKYRPARFLGGYRHEFGSLLDAMADTELGNAPESDLALHLIAAHHGHARPHFKPQAWDVTNTMAKNADTAVEVLRRFSRLQQRFGRWGLAWLESLVRCADQSASKMTGELTNTSISQEERS